MPSATLSEGNFKNVSVYRNFPVIQLFPENSGETVARSSSCDLHMTLSKKVANLKLSRKWRVGTVKSNAPKRILTRFKSISPRAAVPSAKNAERSDRLRPKNVTKTTSTTPTSSGQSGRTSGELCRAEWSQKKRCVIFIVKCIGLGMCVCVEVLKD